MDGRQELQFADTEKCLKLLNQLPEYCTDWYMDLKAGGKSPSTCKSYLSKIKNYLDFTKSPDITKANINAFLISKQPCSHAQQNLLWSALNSLCTFLEEEGKLNNPLSKNSRPGGSDLDRINESRTYLTKEDFRKILAATKANAATKHQQKYHKKTATRDTAIMQLFMCTGLRESALISLDLSNLNLEKETLFVYDKGEVAHKYSISNCMESLNSWLSERPDETEALFTVTRAGETSRMSVQNVVAITKKYTEIALGKSLSPHKLRAGVCSILYEETHDIEFVRRFIGHSSVDITKRYIVTDMSEQNRGAQLLNL